MQKGINKVTLIGNLGADPDIRATQNGTTVANLSIATSEVWNDKNTGQKQERTEWHKIVFFGKVSEVLRDYAKKGTKLYVEGSLRTRKWQDKDGVDRYTTEIVGREMQLMGDGGSQGQEKPAGNSATSQPQYQDQGQDQPDPTDIPF